MGITKIIWFLLALALVACAKQENIETPSSTKEEGDFVLGRTLFYDKGLSANGEVSCASCHKQELAFADGVALGTGGVSGEQLVRNSPTLTNVGNQQEFFHDGGAHDLVSQCLGPLTHPDEMGVDLKEMLVYLESSESYREAFEAVYGQGEIKVAYVQMAIAAFQTALVSSNNKYDQYLRGEASLSSVESQGLQLFLNNCSSCHSGTDLRDDAYHNNGLDAEFDFADPEDVRWGRFRITNNPDDKGKYKTPTLRNIALTYPYMHDGRLASLQEVIRHYSEGIKSSASLDEQLPEGGFRFTEEEKSQLLAFLKTLTDTSFIEDSRFRL